ncbi:MAG: YwaF family protein [Acutalibacter muris]|nr:YwaF family protein [Acutalibacter muris]
MALCAALWIFYSRWGAGKRRLCRRILAALLVCDELFKYGIALHSGQFRPSFLPLHLCSINIFLIAADVIRPNQRLREVLYAVCLPGAFFALLFPGWNYLPLWNALCIHSFTAHLLLLLYPLLLIAGGFRPDIRRFAGTLPAALVVVGLVYCFNRVFGTNFMFLSRAGEGNPLSWFESFLGSPGYLMGIPVIAAICWGLLYGVPALRKRA